MSALNLFGSRSSRCKKVLKTKTTDQQSKEQIEIAILFC